MSMFASSAGRHNPASTVAGADAERPLDVQHYQAIREARVRRARLDRAAGVATFNGWSVGVFAVLSVPFAFFSLVGLVMCLGLAAVTYHEFKGRDLLRQLDERGPRLLGFNQLAFGVLIVGYCLWSLYAALTGPSPYAEYLAAEPALTQSLGSIDELYRVAALAVYGTVILLTLPYQGLMAWYYFSRGAHLRAYVAQTPDWVTELERAAR